MLEYDRDVTLSYKATLSYRVIVTLSCNVMMMSPKCLDLDCFGLFSCIFFRRKYNSKRLKNIFRKFDSEPIASHSRVKNIMMFLKCLDFNYFESVLNTFFRMEQFFKEIEVDFWCD